jgi:nucleotide-binding universal stress UspA family protein
MSSSVADEQDADLIVVGTRGACFAERFERPSVSEAVVGESGRDVLIVHGR